MEAATVANIIAGLNLLTVMAGFVFMHVRTQRISAVVDASAGDVHRIELATNSMKDALVDATKISAGLVGEKKGFAAGVIAGSGVVQAASDQATKAALGGNN